MSCISIINLFTSQLTESLSNVPCQGSWFLAEEHCIRRNCSPWWLHGWASRLTPTVHSVCFCTQAAAIILISKFLILLEVGQAIQEGTGVNCFCCYRWTGWEEIKTLLRGGNLNSSAIKLLEWQTSGLCWRKLETVSLAKLFLSCVLCFLNNSIFVSCGKKKQQKKLPEYE